MTVYGRKSAMRLFVAYDFQNGSGYMTLSIKKYRGMNKDALKQIQEYLQKNVPDVKGNIVITNWKELRP